MRIRITREIEGKKVVRELSIMSLRDQAALSALLPDAKIEEVVDGCTVPEPSPPERKPAINTWYCRHCGQPIPRYVRICPECGGNQLDVG